MKYTTFKFDRTEGVLTVHNAIQTIRVTVYDKNHVILFNLYDVAKALRIDDRSITDVYNTNLASYECYRHPDTLDRLVTESGLYRILHQISCVPIDYYGQDIIELFTNFISETVVPKMYRLYWNSIHQEPEDANTGRIENPEDSTQYAATVELHITDLQKMIADMQRSVDALLRYNHIPIDALLNDCHDKHTIGFLAEHYGVSRPEFLDMLENVSVIFRDGRYYGFTETEYIKEYIGEGGCIEDDGEHDYSFRIYLIDLDETELTYEGIHYIYNKLASRNIYPKW